MSKADDFLKFCLQHIGEWSCSMCGTGSNQPAAIFREVKKRGYRFAEESPNRWAKTMYCEKCGENRTHYKLLSPKPEFEEQKRYNIDKDSRKRIITLLDGRDAFTGASISSVAEIDHKIPWTRLKYDYDPRHMTDEEICAAFQLLTREHNLLKDRACDKCKKTNIRPPFIGISFWYNGNQVYSGSCVGCGWYDGIKWREEANKRLKN